MLEKSLPRSGFLLWNCLQGPKWQISLLVGNLPGDGHDQHCVASQAFRVSENFLLRTRKARQIWAFLIAMSL